MYPPRVMKVRADTKWRPWKRSWSGCMGGLVNAVAAKNDEKITHEV